MAAWRGMLFVMAMREQVTLTSGADFWHTHTPPVPGLPAITLTDGPHGVRKQAEGAGYSPESVPATCFPTASALAATWDVALLEEVGVALGTEARTQSVSVLLGPGANIKRSALCGRNFEYFSEDPYLSSRMAAAWIRGVQSAGVGASLKHFAVNNQEFRRYSIDALVDDRALREIYLASFEHAVTEARPATVMAAYNRVNGTHCSENHWLLTTVLREQWGFGGLVVSDWGAVTARSRCLAAGLDLEMPGYGGRGDDAVLAAVEAGELDAADVTRAAAAVTRLIERTEPARVAAPGYDQAAHHTLARRAAEAGAVLLKNDGVLPLTASSRVAVIGEFAKQPRYQGAGSSGITPHRLDDAWTDLTGRLGTERLTYAPGYRRGSGRTDSALLDEARAVARDADVTVVFAGLPDSYETEGVDRADLSLPEGHDALIAAVAAMCPRVVVVLANGAPVTMPWHDDVAAVVECYLGGQAAGSAISRILTGDAEPGGRLAETFPLHPADNPVHVWPAGPAVVEYRESIFVGYRYYDAVGRDVRYPFGHGLSYTTFAWSELEIAEVFDGTDDTETRFDVTVRITNTGDRPGSEVVQVYVHDVESTVFRPEQELAGFAKVFLVPGESRRITIPVDRRAFAFWDTTIDDWSVESGEFEIRVGASSRDIREAATVRLESDRDGFDPGPLAYHDSPVFERAAFAELYGKPLPDNAVDEPGRYTVDTPIADIRHPASTLLTRVMRRRVAAMAPTLGEDDPLSLLFERSLQELPPRMMPMLTQGTVTPAAAAAFVDICNGHGLRGIRAMGAALRQK